MNFGIFVSRFGDYLQFSGALLWAAIIIVATIYAIKGVNRVRGLFKRG